MYQVTFVPQQKQIEVLPGSTLLDAAIAAGVEISADCGGKGTCGKCKVKIISARENESKINADSKHLSPGEIAKGWVLACQHKVAAPVVLNVGYSGSAGYRKKATLTGIGPNVPLESAVEKKLADLSPPDVKDQISDAQRLFNFLGIKGGKVPRKILSNLPRIMRKKNFQVTAVLIDGELRAVESGDTTRDKYGLAVDIGTTTVMVSLVDLNKGEILSAASSSNRQQAIGADVIARITYAAEKEDGLYELQKRAVASINEAIQQVTEAASIPSNEIYQAVVVGNTTMSHLFSGIDPTYLAPAPFVPAFSHMLEIDGEELGLNINPLGKVIVLPNIAGYVGSDTLGVLLATRLENRKGNCLALDIGTNGELMLASKGKVLTCSTAAGPAFEGAQIRKGMRAAEGAIETVIIKEDVYLEVIGWAAPVGICGSGIIDTAAQLVKAGVINEKGAFINESEQSKLSPALKRRLRPGEKGWEFILVEGKDSADGEDIVFSQKDIRELQLAKGAIAAGTRILLKEMGLQTEDLDEVFLAGAFGSFIKKESALALGLLPPVEREKITTAGNAAGDGAKMALVSTKERDLAVELAGRVRHIELSGRKDFQHEFINGLNFVGS